MEPSNLFNVFSNIKESINYVVSSENLQTVCEKICIEFGFDSFLLSTMSYDSFTEPEFTILTNYKEAWIARYHEKNYISIDPIVQHCVMNNEPILWEDVAALEISNVKIKAFMNDARLFGLCSGISCGINDPSGSQGLFSLASKNDDQETLKRIRSTVPYVFSLAHCLYEPLKKIAATNKKKNHIPKLTKREKECLIWAAEGKTASETATILGISSDTVVFHIKNSMEKLGIKSKNQAIARALSMGILTREALYLSQPLKNHSDKPRL